MGKFKIEAETKTNTRCTDRESKARRTSRSTYATSLWGSVEPVHKLE